MYLDVKELFFLMVELPDVVWLLKRMINRIRINLELAKPRQSFAQVVVCFHTIQSQSNVELSLKVVKCPPTYPSPASHITRQMKTKSSLIDDTCWAIQQVGYV